MANKIQLVGKISPSVKTELSKVSQKLLKHFKINQSSLDVIFLSDQEMVSIKSTHLKGKIGPANTLSFKAVPDFPDPENKEKPLGEIYINLDITKGKLEEILPLLIHSFLHLLGYHHQKERDMIAMNRLAENLLKEVRESRRL